MTRLQKKCLIASMGAHVLVGAILLLSAAFAGRHKEEEEVPPMLTMIPTRLVDALGSGGGDPTVTALPAPAPKIVPPVIATPPRPEVKPEPNPVEPLPEATPKPEPPPPAPARKTKPTPPPPEPDQEEDLPAPKDNSNKHPKPKRETKKTVASPSASETKKHEIKVNLTPVKTTGPSAAEIARAARHRAEAAEKQKAALEAYRSAQEQRSAALDNILARLDKGLSTGTSIVMPGKGGEAFANYGMVVRSVYDAAWSAPADAPENSAKVEIKVIVSRDGHIVSSEITRKSGNASLDKSVQRALNAVRQFPPFPAESSDRERIFIINFDLKAKRQTG